MIDICLCASTECPKYNQCYRGNGVDRRGKIFTSSYLSEICNEDTNYSTYIDIEEWSKPYDR